VLISGNRGAGKTTLCQLLKPSLWITGEQSAEQVRDNWFRLHGPDHAPLDMAYASTWETLYSELARLGPGQTFVVDSISQFAGSPDQASALAKECVEATRVRGAKGFFIAQYTKDGQVAGPNKIQHMVDVCIEILIDSFGLRRVAVVKNRFGPEPTTYFQITADGIEPVPFDYAYTVEGTLGRYTLNLVPSRKATYSDLFELMIEHNLKIQRPCATAYTLSPLYRGGWCAPTDVIQRQIFAEENGLHWLTPQEVFDRIADQKGGDSESDRTDDLTPQSPHAF